MPSSVQRPAALWAEEFGRRLANLRLRQNLSQAELARRAGISVRTLVRMESGESPQLENFVRVLQALGLERRLDLLLPAPEPGPIAELEARRRAPRQRASRKRGRREPREGWTWDDES